MSFLTPLYIAGLLAVSLPVIFHLIRRTPRGRNEFSSLMFLKPSPPRLSRRSRLDNLLLLLLRGLALTLLVLAFARPFLRDASYSALDSPRGRRIVVLLDTSASMRQGDLWPQAVSEVEQVLSEIETGDDVALVTFDKQTNTVVDFDSNATVRKQNLSTVLKQRLSGLRPTWNPTDLGSALVATADGLAVAHASDRSHTPTQIIVVSDMQQGARIDALQAYEWPSDVKVDIHQPLRSRTTNASVTLLDDVQSDALVDAHRVRVTNASDSSGGQFQVHWAAEGDRLADDQAVSVFVPPGQSRVVRLPDPPADLSADRLVLTGDQSPFDNSFFLVPRRQQEVTVVYVGSGAEDDPDGLRYYLERALDDTNQRTVTVEACQGDQALPIDAEDPPRLAVVTQAVPPETVEQLKEFLEDGGTVLFVPKSQDDAKTLVRFDQYVDVESSDPDDAERGSRRRYAMLAEIDFTHPLFSAFAGPQYNDFTRIHFWRHRRVTLNEDSPAHVVARFDNGDPALWEQTFGKGRLFVLTSGWHPKDSQLALSSKFVPLLTGFLEGGDGGRLETTSYTVGDPVALLPSADATATVIKPDGTQFVLPTDALTFTDTDQPGLYRVQQEDRTWQFVVNVDYRESQTAAMDVEQLEQYGVSLGSQPTGSEQIEHQRHLRDVELEGRQQIWRWLLVVALGVLTLETWLASRNQQATVELAGEN